ncbi:polysaccharide deacetylase family protein [Helicobacter baculiformis]|uniref:Polysaccharide deacetylase family protein n=1 Tax=Helicobacter baculiformis TaxID=427351 RepID=A0ABV7ZHJ0_9HELI|nr:polysaccharide deacetylase family protein [Helicobacter baculiformis]
MLNTFLRLPILHLLSKLSNNTWAQRYYEGQGVIFMLHEVLNMPSVKSDLSVSVAFLDFLITLLKNKGFSFVSLDEICDLLQRGKFFHKAVHFTLDDGYQSTLNNASPIFKAHDVPFTIYICTNYLGKAGMLDWEGVKTLYQEPLCTIGGHTQSHPKLSQIKERGEVMAEIQGAHAILKERLGQEIRHFAYPYGGVNACGLREVEVVQELGLRSAVTTRRGTLYPAHRDFLTCLPRVMLVENFKLHEIWRIRKYQVATL